MPNYRTPATRFEQIVFLFSFLGSDEQPPSCRQGAARAPPGASAALDRKAFRH